MNTHPEQKHDEVFVGNTKIKSLPLAHLATLRTVRLGNVAYDLEGKKIPVDHMRPLFIGRSEADAYDRIMMARLSAITNGDTLTDSRGNPGR